MSKRLSKQEKERVLELLQQTTRIAREYYRLTGRPLGVTGEIAEAEAVRLLGLDLAGPRQEGYDATRRQGRGVEHVQVKGRVMQPGHTDSAKIGAISFKHEWDTVALVLLNEEFVTTAIYEATRESIGAELTRPGSKARQRGVLSVSMFKRLGKQVWPAVA